MKNKLTSLVLMCVMIAWLGIKPEVSLAQFRPAIDVQEWPTGKVVLVDGDTLYGALTYYRTQDIVNVHHEDGTMSSLSPVNVEYFIAQEMPSGRSYTFRTLRWDMGKAYSDFKKPTFFEELNRGLLTLIMRETYVRRDGSNIAASNYFYDPNNYSSNQFTDQVKELYYILLPDGEILSLRNLRKDLHSLFGKKSKDVKSYVKLNKLDYEKPHELIAIVNYFNTISNTTSQVH
ncbi:hypothetical protein [uncultured Pontibacter sp.]|uniref:hypothetical protein n=1 Tax=uncultured Pontibacter sp. TaxID=453356 RepID=UPI00262EC30B|nr:hypothetical protein [uncultured Pontibacter sp.]